MKYADCNARQKKAYRNIYHACNWFLGGLENNMLDNPEGSEEYEAPRQPSQTMMAWSRSFTGWQRPTFTTTGAAASTRRQRDT